MPDARHQRDDVLQLESEVRRHDAVSELRRERRRKGTSGIRVEPPVPQRPSEKWDMDFVHDGTAYGRRCRTLAVMDQDTRECPAIEVDRSLGDKQVVSVLDRLSESRSLPETITGDNGPEFTGEALDEWACRTE